MAATTILSPILPNRSRHYSSLAVSSASYVVRVHTKHGIKTLSFNMLADLFTFTAKKAAKHLGISSRTLIRVCRSLGIKRWPYLSFRSEKNVERIRQEALKNLRHKIEKEGESLHTSVLHPNAPSLRGASAKRLLQVKTSQLVLPPRRPAAPSELTAMRSSSWCSSPTLSNTSTNLSDDDERMSESDESYCMTHTPMLPQTVVSSSPPISFAAPLNMPLTKTHGFNLDIQRVNPNKEAAAISSSVTGPWRQNSPWTLPRMPVQAGALSTLAPRPSLDLLFDASILTSLKNDMLLMQSIHKGNTQQLRQQHARARTMSMQDILTSSH